MFIALHTRQIQAPVSALFNLNMLMAGETRARRELNCVPAFVRSMVKEDKIEY